ncbi:ABC transporter permease [Luteolibacter flavescens]|uniref:ABC transporter permease n=1 Tax=Luteolibacter flavescens TaxID=1859460 RepID=A0ABT3FSD5_9BACT|nr:FtsX-like permease family protein [Luteolibacter flavescens]MCW1886497.1 ABC transporter permease [Luteolibacter flavescens]
MSSGSRSLPRFFLAALFHPWTWRMAWRDSRSQRGRLLIFSLAIVSGIAALTAIHSLKASVQTGIETQAKALLGSDLQISSRQPVSAEDLTRLKTMAQSVSRETSFPSMLKFLSGGGTRMVQVRGIEGGYPYYGEVETNPAGGWQKLKEGPGILLEPALLDQFGAKPGDEVELGGLRLPILGSVTKPAPKSSRFSGFAPEAYVRLGDIEATGLLSKNSMSSHQVHLEIPDAAGDLKETIRQAFPDTPWRLETPADRRENLGDALEHFQRFLGILALAALVLGAIGVAGAVHAHVVRRVPTVAILRCLGCPGQVAFAIYFVQAAALGLLGAVVGAGLGIILQTGTLSFFEGELPISVKAAPEWAVVARTTAAGFAVCCGFALLPLLKIRRISPAATLRGGATLEGNTLRALPVYALLLGLLVVLALTNDPEWKRALSLVGGLAVAFAVLVGVAKLLIVVTRRSVNSRMPYLLRQGLSNLHRPRNQTLLFLLSLGLGTFLLVTVLLTGSLIRERMNLTQNAESPNLYLIDVQPDQVAGVRETVEKQGLPVLESAPMVTMRIEAIRGVAVRDVPGLPRWISRREFRSTYRAEMNATETLVAGEWHSSIPDPDQPVPLSLEEKIAGDMKVGIGDELTLDVQGVPVKARITSLRKVDWSRFNLNFFMVFPPGVLEDAPGFHVVTTKTPTQAASGELQRSLVADFANVTAIDLTLILETVRDILSKISTVVSVLAGFTVLAGLPIVIGTMLNGRDVRLRESVLLRTLGASAKQVRTILVIEYAALGVLSALTGVVLAVVGNAALAKFVFQGSPWPDLTVVAGAFVAATGISVIGGLALSRGVCHHSPLEILRGGA